MRLKCFAFALALFANNGALAQGKQADNKKQNCSKPPSATCNIKGNISRNGRIYFTPDDPMYPRVKINCKERWFCSPKEAEAAGWRRPGNWRPGKSSHNDRRDCELPNGIPDPTCDIKGNRTKIYHVRGSRFYAETVIDTAAGERWFCSEGQARDAGWRPPRNAGQRQDCDLLVN